MLIDEWIVLMSRRWKGKMSGRKDGENGYLRERVIDGRNGEERRK